MVEDPSTCRLSSCGNREISCLATELPVVRIGKAEEALADDARAGESSIVRRKPANKVRNQALELVEGREGALGNTCRQSTHRTLSRASVSQALERVRVAICYGGNNLSKSGFTRS